jgi:transcription elongation factor Elf1
MGSCYFEWECPYCQNVNTENISFCRPEDDGTMDSWCGECRKRTKIEIEIHVQKVTGYLACILDREEQ